MNVVDSSGWLEYFADGPNADFFAPAIENPSELIVPTISIYEVFKRVLQQRTESEALQAAATMQQGMVIDLGISLVLEAARLAHQIKLPMADSIMLASARMYDAVLWTQNGDFQGLEGVQYIEKK
jgi:predicted nucleic acid-binding protein